MKGDISEIKDRVWSDLEQNGRSHTSTVVEVFEVLCESPIEIMLGAAAYLSFSTALGPLSPTKLLRVQQYGEDLTYSGQWVLVPQFQWGKYRIDFALYTKLPYPIFIECDGHDFHERTKQDAQRDREKDRTIQAAGIPILRFTGSEIYRSPHDCAYQIFNFTSSRIMEYRKTDPVEIEKGKQAVADARRRFSARKREKST